MSKLGIDIDQVSEIDPVQLVGWVYGEGRRKKRGLDNVLRSSGYQVTWLFFSSDQVYVYQHVFSTDEDARSERTEEFFYRDITSFSTESETVEFTQGVSGGGCTSKTEEQRLTENVEYFRLVVPGSSFRASILKSDYTQSSIRAMQQKLREKKLV